MNVIKIIMTLPFLCWGGILWAQVPQESSAMPEQWQLSLDVIKSKAQALMVENNGLHLDYQKLEEQVQYLQQEIIAQQNKNEGMRQFLRDRNNRTDQQVRIEELTQTVKSKTQDTQELDKQLEDLQKKKSAIDQKIQLLKYTISDMDLHQQDVKQNAPPVVTAPQVPVDDQLSKWRADLENENKQEVLLEDELAAYKTGDKSQQLNADAINEKNKELQARLDLLNLQRVQLDKKSSEVLLTQANSRLFSKLKMKKEQLEININAYELRLEELRDSSLMAMSWKLKKKKLIHQMVQVDAKNNQMRDNIKVLHEDIDILRDQVAKLERRIDFAQGKDSK